MGASLNFIVLYASDLERSRQFYEALGLTFTREQHGQGPMHYAAEMNGVVLELYPHPAGDDSPSAPAAITLGITVSSIDATRLTENMGQLGAAAASSVTRGRLRLKDHPDGHTVLLSVGPRDLQ
jgi:catechol 2,3-dioxygenase-like lactoylglutathione lyase family enzyme